MYYTGKFSVAQSWIWKKNLGNLEQLGWGNAWKGGIFLSELQGDIKRDKKLADKKMKWRFQVVKSSRTCPLGGIPGVFVPPLQ